MANGESHELKTTAYRLGAMGYMMMCFWALSVIWLRYSQINNTKMPGVWIIFGATVCDTADMKLEIIRCTIFPDGNQYLIESGRYRSKIDKKGSVIVFLPTFRCG